MHTILVKDSEGQTVTHDFVGGLDEAKTAASSMWEPGKYVSIRTKRGTTWHLTLTGWRHDTGRRG